MGMGCWGSMGFLIYTYFTGLIKMTALRSAKLYRFIPAKTPTNPLTGVFATHSPRRPNLIALTVCRIESIAGNIIHIAEIDAYDGSPVIDIKCYIPGAVPDEDVRLPDWV